MASRLQMSVYLSFAVREEFAVAAYLGSLPAVRRQEAVRRALIAGLQSEGVDLEPYAAGFEAPATLRRERPRRRQVAETGATASQPAAPVAANAAAAPMPAPASSPVASGTPSTAAAQTSSSSETAPAVAAGPVSSSPATGPDIRLARSLAALT